MCEVLGMEKKRYNLSLQWLTIQLSWFVEPTGSDLMVSGEEEGMAFLVSSSFYNK